MSTAAAHARLESEPPFDLDEVNRKLEGARAEEILQWSVDHFAHGRFAQVSAFGPGSAVLIHMLVDIAPDLPVIFIDTLHHFQETLQHLERVRERYNLNLLVYRPAASREEFEARYGECLWEHDLARYQQVAKVEPFLEATRNLDGWITGRRRDQAKTRTMLLPVEGGEKLRVNPLVHWSRGEVWRYILEHELPYNPLHDKGYTSIGDEPLTTPVASEEDERAGRWRGAAITECGIHLV
jgi:phosphoadenosine phosphosulfate reductase